MRGHRPRLQWFLCYYSVIKETLHADLD
jgi:hypothetical protein